MGLGDTPETRGLRSTSLVVTQGMITLLDMMADVLLYNTTALLVEKNLTNFNCNTFFTSINASLSSICQNANYNLGTPMAMVPWIRAFIEGQYGATWQSIQNLFGINSVI